MLKTAEIDHNFLVGDRRIRYSANLMRLQFDRKRHHRKPTDKDKEYNWKKNNHS